MSARRRIALVAGEASGDLLGAALIGAARRLDPGIEFVGIAGPAMRAAGCEAWYPAEDLAVMGLVEVLRHLPRIARIRTGLLARLRAEPPAAYVGIDAPDFNLRVAPALRAAGVPTAQYVCPSVWAWRRGRVRLLQRACDQVLCLLPFEVSFLEGSGVPATFVGHPFADQLAGGSGRDEARARLGLGMGTVVGLLPGSRIGEVERLGPAFLGAAAILRGELPGVRFCAPMASPAVRQVFEAQARAATAHDVVLVDGRAREVMAASDGLLVASGTATLEAMLVNRPMVVAYRLAPLTYWLARGLDLVKVRHFSLPNLLAGEALVPELLQHEATPDRLAAALLELLRSPQRRQRLGERFAEIGAGLRRGASERAAVAVLELARRR